MRATLTILSATLVLTTATSLYAQQPPPAEPPETEAGATPAPELGSVDIGFRGTDSSGDTARLERYRDLRSTAFSRILFDRGTDAYLFDANAVEVGLRDQRYHARYIGGKIRFTGAFDSIPLNYSYLTTTPWVEQSPDVLHLDLAARQQVQAKQVVGVPQNPTDLNTPSIYRGIAHPFDLQSLRQTGSASVAYDVSESVDLTGSFSSAKRSGQQPWGASFAFNVANEVPLTLDNRTNDASAGLEWTRTKGMFRIGWNGSWFDNNVSELVWDNAFRATDTNPIDPSGYSNGNGSSQGRSALAPSNSLNSVSALGLYRMPAHSSVNGAVVFTRMSQDDPLIPWTINPVINTPAVFAQYPHLAGLPRPTAEAEVKGINGMLNFTTRPSRVWGLTARYRYNDHDNNTPAFDGTQYVRFDAVPEATGGFSEQFDITENTFDLNTNFNLMRYTSLRVGYGYDSFDRTGRSFSSMTDNTFRTSLDVIGSQYLTLRGLYEYTSRKGSGFSEDAIEEGGAQPGLRFYDEADRTRNKGTIVLSFTPLSALDVNVSVGSGKDTYKGPGHEFGLLSALNTSYNVGVDYNATDMIAVGANYGRDHYATDQKSRNANPPPDPTFTDPARDWTLDNTENVNNFLLYLDLRKIARRTNVHVTYDYSDSDNGFVFGGPRILSLTAAGQFIPLPNVTNKWQRFAADAQHFVTSRVGFAFTYWYERLDTSNYAVIDLPGQPGAPRIDYLGEISTGYYGARPYKGNTVFLRLLYLF